MFLFSPPFMNYLLDIDALFLHSIYPNFRLSVLRVQKSVRSDIFVAALPSCVVNYIVSSILSYTVTCIVSCVVSCILGCIVNYTATCIVSCVVSCALGSVVSYTATCIVSCVVSCTLGCRVSYTVTCIVSCVVRCIVVCTVSYTATCMVISMDGCVLSNLMGVKNGDVRSDKINGLYGVLCICMYIEVYTELHIELYTDIYIYIYIYKQTCTIVIITVVTYQSELCPDTYSDIYLALFKSTYSIPFSFGSVMPHISCCHTFRSLCTSLFLFINHRLVNRCCDAKFTHKVESFWL